MKIIRTKFRKKQKCLLCGTSFLLENSDIFLCKYEMEKLGLYWKCPMCNQTNVLLDLWRQERNREDERGIEFTMVKGYRPKKTHLNIPTPGKTPN